VIVGLNALAVEKVSNDTEAVSAISNDPLSFRFLGNLFRGRGSPDSLTSKKFISWFSAVWGDLLQAAPKIAETLLWVCHPRYRPQFCRRRGGLQEGAAPDLLPELARLKCRSAILDGEVVALAEDGLPTFQNLQKRSTRHVNLVAFDLLMLDGADFRDKPLEWRRAKLENLLKASDTVRITLSPELDGHPDELLQMARQLRLEGIVAKERDSIYESGERTGSWVKHRAELEGTFLIGGYEPGTHGFDELILGERKGRKLHFVARLRNGFVAATRRKITEAITPHVQSACPFSNLPEPGKSRWGQGLDAEAMKKCRWLKPKVAVDVAFLEWTEGHKLRHPRFVALKQSRATS
jgi:ATP-dependent DNA ligase